MLPVVVGFDEMPCYHPIRGWKSKRVGPSGKRAFTVSRSEAYIDLPMTVSCGQCIGCRIRRSQEWALRCVHEAQLHDENSFITLTYNDKNLPADGSLHVDHFQKFMKRFRKKYEPTPIRFFHCGEYGPKLGRPHYHAAIFGFDFPDKILWQENRGNRLYRSPDLESLWPYGYSSIGALTFQSAAYVARYIMKKHCGPNADEIYQGRQPEYVTMSRRPGIGKKWFDQFGSDVFPSDEIVFNGRKFKPPRFYDNLYEVTNPNEMTDIKFDRVKQAKLRAELCTPERLAEREEFKSIQLSQLKRPLK